MSLSMDSEEGVAGFPEGSGEDSLDRMFPLKWKSNKRLGTFHESSTQFNCTSSTLTSNLTNAVTKRYRKSAPSDDPCLNRTSSHSFVDPSWNLLDLTAFDRPDSASALSEASSVPCYHLSAECPSLPSANNAVYPKLRSIRHGEMGSGEMCKEHFTMRNCPTRPCSLIPAHIRDYKPLALPNTDSLTSQNSSSDSGNSNRTFVAVLPKFEGAFYEDSRSEIRWDFSNGIICPPLYADDIYRAMRELEKGFRLKRNFLSRQRELDEKDRVRVVDWISHHHANFCLKLETLHLAVSILDRLLCVVKFPRSKGEAIAAVALMIASKVEDVAPLKVVILVENIISYKIEKRAVMQIEQSALYHLNYRAQTPTAYNFANYFNMLVKSDPLQIELVNVRHFLITFLSTLHGIHAQYLLELALRVITFAGSLPSEVALAALLLARTILRRDFSRRWMLMHFGRCGIRYEDLETAMCLFFKIFGRASTLAPNVFNEYCKREHFGIALA